MIHLLNVADREWQRRFLEQCDKEREEDVMEQPKIYILVEAGFVQEVRVAGIATPDVTIFDMDLDDDGRVEKAWEDACKKSRVAA